MTARINSSFGGPGVHYHLVMILVLYSHTSILFDWALVVVPLAVNEHPEKSSLYTGSLDK